MIKISKSEAFKLREVLKPGNIHQTHTRYPHYYMVESPYNIRKLKRIRDKAYGCVRVAN